MSEDKIWDWFAAALLHDLGKTILDKNGQCQKHKDLSEEHLSTILDDRKLYPHYSNLKLNFEALLGPEMVKRIATHHGVPPNSLTPAVAAFIMSDGIQKAMHKAGELSDESAPRQLRHKPAFCPYYGREEEGWDGYPSATLVMRVVSDLQEQKLTLKTLLEVQRHFARFPHTTWLPHLSLRLHHRFTAAIFYLLYRKLADQALPIKATEMTDFEFSVLTVAPEALSLFYRLSDVRTHSAVIEDLRKTLFKKVFRQHAQNIPGLAPNCNPFEFFSGDSMVLIYDRPQVILAALQEALDSNENLRSLDVEMATYRLRVSRRTKDGLVTFWADSISAPEQKWSMLSTKTLHYPKESLYRCTKCGKPAEAPTVTERGDRLCAACLAVRSRRKAKGVSFEAVAQSPRGKQRVGFIFLNLPEDLREHAKAVADHDLLPAIERHRMVQPGTLCSTDAGLFEYLQAVDDISAFQDQVEQRMKDLAREVGGSPAHVLIRSPTLCGYLVREDVFWLFLGFLNRERQSLHLDTALSAILCRHNMPFWSLMDKFASYDQGGDTYYDVSGGSMVMFNKEEVASIRELAALAEKDKVPTKQLKDLSKFALSHNVDELLLEIDVRKKSGRLRWKFAENLEDALVALASTGEAGRDSDKRATFIDYVMKLGRPQKTGRRQKGGKGKWHSKS